MDEPRKGTILIVDDEPNVLWFISKVCHPMGYETLTAGSGVEGLRVIQECGEKLDLVLLDLNMPGMSGIEMLRSLRLLYPDLPVIILTALHDKQDECEKHGIDAFIRKPYSLEELHQQIEKVTDRRSFERSKLELEPGLIPSARIMIVDDEREVCELLGAALLEDFEDVDFRVRWAHTGDEALKLSLDFEPDIAIIDIKMPHMWGDELIRRFQNGQGHCPRDFIIYTSVTDPAQVNRAKVLGHKMLSKPTDLDLLIQLLQKICIRHRLLKKKDDL